MRSWGYKKRKWLPPCAGGSCPEAVNAAFFPVGRGLSLLLYPVALERHPAVLHDIVDQIKDSHGGTIPMSGLGDGATEVDIELSFLRFWKLYKNRIFHNYLTEGTDF